MGLMSKSRTSLSSAPLFPSMKNTRANGRRWSMLPPSSSRGITRKATEEQADRSARQLFTSAGIAGIALVLGAVSLYSFFAAALLDCVVFPVVFGSELL